MQETETELLPPAWVENAEWLIVSRIFSYLVFYYGCQSKSYIFFFSCVAYFFVLKFHDPTCLSAACCNNLQVLQRRQKRSVPISSKNAWCGVLPNTIFLFIWITSFNIIFSSCCQNILEEKKKSRPDFHLGPKFCILVWFQTSVQNWDWNKTTKGFFL